MGVTGVEHAPSRDRAARGAARLVALLWVAALVSPVATVAAAEPTIRAPRAEVTFLEGITFTADVALTPDVARREIVLDVEGSGRSIVAAVEETVPGSGRLTYRLETPGGSMMPNTSIVARFRLTLADGAFVVGPPATVEYADTRLAWQTLAGELVTVHWTEGGAAFGRRAVEIADAAVRDVSDLLGVAESERIDFFVYADRDAFYDVLGPASRENVGGQAHPDIRTLFANIAPGVIDDPWVGIVIPHELIHLVFDTAVENPYHYPPRWLNEGVAVYLSEGYTTGDRTAVESAVESRSLMPLDALSGQFPTTADQFRLAYSESVSAVEFLVREHGQPAMVDLVRSYAGGVTDDEAFENAIGTDTAGFEAAWLESLGAEAPVPYGPVDAPPGPVPSDWIGEGELPGPIPTGSPRATDRPDSPGPTGSDDVVGLLGTLFVGLGAAAGLAGWAIRRRRARRAAATAAARASTIEPTPGQSLWATHGAPPPAAYRAARMSGAGLDVPPVPASPVPPDGPPPGSDDRGDDARP